MNQLVLSAQLLERGAMRYTPAGLAGPRPERSSTSRRSREAGQPRKVSLEIKAVAIGGDRARRSAPADRQQPRGFAGFLSAQRNGRGIVFHITELH